MTPSRDGAPPVTQDDHDHRHCIERVVAELDRRVAGGRARVTPVRRRVLEILLESHRALGAYEVLRRLDEAGMGSQPPVVYRALDFLLEQGFVHRIEGLNAYVACTHPHEAHDPVFMICHACRDVAESHRAGPGEDLQSTADALGFRIERTVVEAIGLCASCRAAAEDSPE